MFGIDDAALATMLAGGISTAAALYTNKKNRESQENANAINWEIARQNNAVQVEMANTAHQREVRDLRRAGLNPILSAGGSGAPTPSLQGASIDPVHTDNAFDGLANSAKGLGRYLSQEYKQHLSAMDLANKGAALENDAMRADQEHRAAIYDSENEALTAEKMRGAVDKVAAMQEFGLTTSRRADGTLELDIANPARMREAVDLAREGLRSDLKLRANANWRSNLSSFTPFVSPAAVNSAGAAYRQFSPAVRSMRRIP